ncbi:3-methyl-2-oxobutanoate hydroxymethyltransferase [Virgibacillus halophilus]|uniref:3-methyl-2-oxobutanoate hydroxymethyltransferase n=1 Tax=Tigheibacillus halophilus TaxID=361280 RepID=UPI0036402A85
MLGKFDLLKMKEKNNKLTMVTAYDYPSAKTAEKAGMDMILVGDSLGMVVLGYDSTVRVTVDDMLHHAKAARRGAPNTYLIVDMPFMSYHVSLSSSLENARRLFQETGCQALKLEGASPETLELISNLEVAGVPVIGHIGLTPQSFNVLGGFKVQGKDQQAGERLLKEARLLEENGAAAVVLECVPDELAKIISRALSIPTIGIGAGKHCDGQVLVYHDLLQYGVDRLPKFAKGYGDFNTTAVDALASYIKEVKNNTFPDADHSFLTKDKESLPKMG